MIEKQNDIVDIKTAWKVFLPLMVLGAGAFFYLALGDHPERAWQAYLINFMIWSGISQGALLFSTVMHTTKARWSHNLSGIAEAFTAFFPISFALFLLLFVGRKYVFTWLHLDLHGKEAWLNLPFLFSRDALALLILYGLGLAYLYHVLRLKLEFVSPSGKIHSALDRLWRRQAMDRRQLIRRISIFSILYMLAFAVVLSLIGFDLVMSMDPHWYSTLFGAYTFVKAFYVGLGAIIILAALLNLKTDQPIEFLPAEFHDIGKLFFAFCLVWADFFYVQFVVIWYGNIPEVTSYIIERTMTAPWQTLAWIVFIGGFTLPFLILLNKRIKTKPRAMLGICVLVLASMWLEHLLLLGPAYHQHATRIPLGLTDVLITLGFMSLMAIAIIFFLNAFADIFNPAKRKHAA